MDNKADITHYLVIPCLRVQNANAISSPLTHGFPSITAFIGLAWALERKICRIKGKDNCPAFLGVGVICHDYQEQTYRNGYRYFTLTRNPLNKKEETAPINEEGRIHLTISLVFAIQYDAWNEHLTSEALVPYAIEIADLLAQMRVAGGTIIPSSKYVQPFILSRKLAEQKEEFEDAMSVLGRGFALVEREDLLRERLEKLRQERPEASLMDAFLSLNAVNYAYDDETKTWRHDREGAGWLVPIPVGYGLLEKKLRPAGSVASARDRTVEFGVAESVFSFGEWRNLSRFISLADLIWYVENDLERGVYRCRNHYVTHLNKSEANEA